MFDSKKSNEAGATEPKTSLADFPEYRQQKGKLAEMQAELRKNQEQQRHLKERPRKSYEDETRERAKAYLSGEEMNTDSAKKTMADLQGKEAILKEAIRMQEGIVSKLKGELSAKICKILRPGYAANVKKMCEGLKLLKEGAKKERELRYRLITGDVSFNANLPPRVFLPFVEDLDQRIDNFLAEVAASGF